MQKPKRVLVIGLDGATWDALDPWIANGSLPNLAKLRRRGTWGVLNSSIPPITAAAWSSFMTGKRPGKHGVFHFIKLFDDHKPQDGRTELVNARNIKSSTLWDILAHHNRQVVLVNVPMTYPPRPVNGVMITGLMTPRNAAVFTYPPELSQQITDYKIDLDRFIDKKPFQDDFDAQAISPSFSLVDEFRDMLEKRAKVTFSLMESKPWDFFMVVFTGTDRMGHYLWPYHHLVHAEGEPEGRQLYQAVCNYYIRLDKIIGELVEKAGEDVVVIIMSDHGMGPVPVKQVHCNNWLHQHGWLVPKAHRAGIVNPDSWSKGLGLPRDKVGRVVRRFPGLLRSRLVERVASSRSTSVDVSLSKAYCIPIFFNIMGIRINLGGNEKEAIRREIMQGLQKIVDPETGEPVVQQVCLGSDYYHGPYADNIPDIIAALDPAYGYSYHLSHYSSIVTKRQVASGPAKHRIEGIFAASGPGIVSRPEPFTSLSIEDIVPTVLHLMELPVPSDMDGRVLTDIVDPVLLETQPIRHGEPIGFWPKGDEAEFRDEVVSEEDEELIRARLEALGYLE